MRTGIEKICIMLFIASSLHSVASDSTATKIDSRMRFYFDDLSAHKKSQPKPEKTGQPTANNEITYEIRINELDKTTPIALQYNKEVKRYIDIYTTTRKRDFERIMGLADLYFPIFEEKLAKYNLPLELKYLAIVESSLNPKAVSKSGAVGLWQFLYHTSSMFDLQITSYIDERCDPYKSTEAACRYFSYLFNIFNDWELAIASFNGGPGEIRNAIERSGGKTNFWELVPYLAEQTKYYVPALIATIYIMNHAADHDMAKKPALFTFSAVDTVHIKKETSFQQISGELGISVEELRFLNPVYKTDVVPVTANTSVLVLPSDRILDFIKKEDRIYSSQTVKRDYWAILKETGDTTGRVKLIHTVGRGEFFHKIALNYQCTVNDIKKWNNLETDNLHPNQELIIWVPFKDAHLYIDNLDQYQDTGYIEYTIQEGDTIWGIAEKFKIKSVAQIKAANQGLDENNIKPGQKIKINW